MNTLIKEKSGQSSGEMILLIGGMIIIVLLIGSYVFNMTNNMGYNLKKLLDNEKELIMNKI